MRGFTLFTEFSPHKTAASAYNEQAKEGEPSGVVGLGLDNLDGVGYPDAVGVRFIYGIGAHMVAPLRLPAQLLDIHGVALAPLMHIDAILHIDAVMLRLADI